MLDKIFFGLLSNPLALGAALSPFIISFINNNRAKIAARAKFEEEELNQARAIADEICGNADRLVYFNEEAIYGIVYRNLNINTINVEGEDKVWTDQDLKVWNGYQEQIQEWNALITKRRAQIEVYFGENTRKNFYRVMKLIEYVERMSNAAFFNQEGSRYFIGYRHMSEEEAEKYSTDSESLIKLFRIERDNLELANTLRRKLRRQPDADTSSEEKPFTTDFRYKYRPIYYHLKEDELFNLRKAMMQAMQKKDVGALRMEQEYRPMQGAPPS